MPPDEPATDQPAGNGADFGLTAEEQAAYNDMRSSPAPGGDPGFVPTEATPADAPAAGAAPKDPPQAGAAAPAAGAGAPPAAGGPAGGAADGDTDDDDEAGAPGPDGVVRTPKRVSYNKFKRLDDEAKKTAADLKAERDKNAKAAETQARLDERLRLINEALTPQQSAAPVEDDDPEPDPEKDIFGHNAWLKRQNVKLRADFDERIGNIEGGIQATNAEQQLASTYMSDARQFAQAEPNFGPAYNYLMQVRIAQLANFHFGLDVTDENCPPLTAPQIDKIKAEVAREEKQLVGQAIKNGKSPAAAVYAMAKMTGYRPQAPGAPAPAAGAAAPANGAGAPAAGAAPTVAAAVAAAAPAAGNGAAAPKPSVKAEIDKIKSGQEAALSLSSGGGAPAPVLNAEKLANMPEEEFGALLDQMSRGELRRVMGG